MVHRPRAIHVYLSNPLDEEIFQRVKQFLGENDSGTFTYCIKSYTENNGLFNKGIHPAAQKTRPVKRMFHSALVNT